jgi:hypothetical protein
LSAVEARLFGTEEAGPAFSTTRAVMLSARLLLPLLLLVTTESDQVS